MIKPKRLQKGDTIGIVSPSSGIWKRSELWRSMAEIEKWGYRVKVGKHADRNHYYLAGNDAGRVEDLMNFFKDDTVDAIFCSQGGYGSARLLRYLDFAIIRSNPKIFLGYSDITALHLGIHKLSRLVTFHGPNALSAGSACMTDYRYEQLLKAIAGNEPIGAIKMAGPEGYLLKINGGPAVEAPLIGGNLTLICATLGTPYEIDTRGKIFFLEELDTEPWVMDHMLTHLLNAGKLQEAAGIVIGECTNCDPLEHKPGFYSQCSLEDVIFDLLEPLGLPVLYGLPLGHTKDLATLPLGVMGRLDAGEGSLAIIETATV